jgi:VanZ family protein
MAKGEIRVIHVPRWLTVFLWLAVSAAMAGSVYLLSGRAYARDTSLSTIIASMRRSTSITSILAAIAPAATNVLFFVPWGAFAFLSLDTERHSRTVTYVAAILLGVAFALALVAWQTLLPTRITRGIDALWNVAGCAGGAMFAHGRKRVRIRFE